MTDTQILTLVITLLGIAGGSWYNSSRTGEVSKRVDDVGIRINDMRDVLRAEAKTMGAELRLEFRIQFSDMAATLVRIENKIDHISEVQASHSERLDKLEGQ